MRMLVISIVALIVGISTGLGITWIEFRGVQEHFQPVSLTKKAATAKSAGATSATGDGPVVVVEGGAKFDFGSLNHDQTREKIFVLRNEGNKPLTISWNGQSCGMCIKKSPDFDSATIEPGGKFELPVIYATKKLQSEFSESAHILTNDPRNSLLELQITGVVTMALKLDPDALVLNATSSSEPTHAMVKLFGFQSDKLELVKQEYNDPSSSSKFEINVKPMDAAAVAAEKYAKAGVELQVQIKPGLPIGPITQAIKLTLLADSERTIELPISGTVIGDLSMYGKNFDPNTNTFSVGVVGREKGLSAEFFLLVKGPTRNDVKISVGPIDPANALQVSLSEPTSLAEGKTVKYVVTVTIPKGAPMMNRLGNAQGEAATVQLQTTHPLSKEIPIKIRFAVE